MKRTCLSSNLSVTSPCRVAAGRRSHVQSGSLAWLLIACLCAGSLGAERPQMERAIGEYSSAMETKDRNLRLEKFARAEQLFRQLIEGDVQQAPIRNVELYVNMGNAALQAERLGPAIAAYRRALALAPQHAQARQNLAYARSLLPDWIRHEETYRLIDSLFFWRAMIPRGQLLILGAACFLVAAVLFSAGYARRHPLTRNLAAVPLLAWAVLSTSLLIGRDEAADRNVVVLSETTVYAADSENAAPRLAKPLPSGAELSLLAQRAQWSEIRLPDGRTGWVLTSTIESLGAA
jgi:tetratricopeptide (TPR) repeat protein